jgi:tetratricopeptide (TPR) repeat protein
MRQVVLVIFLFLMPFVSLAQQSQSFQLGLQYYQQGEFTKAIEVFEDLHNREPLVGTYYQYLFNSLQQLKKYDDMAKLARAQSKRDPNAVSYKVDEGYCYRLEGNSRKADQHFGRLIKEMTGIRAQIVALANAFRQRNEADYARQAYLRGRELLGSPVEFALELADVYVQQGNKGGMISAYLDYLAAMPQQIDYVQNMLQSRLDDNDFPLLRDRLLEGLRQRPDEISYSELLIWLFVQQRDFNSAFIQAKGLDKRLRQQGFRVMQLAAAAVENEDFDAATEMYQYVADNQQGSSVYLEARYKLLTVGQARLRQKARVSRNEWVVLATKYQEYIAAFPLFPNLPEVKRALAGILAFELRELDSAMTLLENTLDEGRGDQRTLAAVKLDLGDIYLLAAEYWDAALKYGQVEKDYPNEPLGQEAKFRNARLSFYRGEFEWSQAQLDVLKASTTQRISNDAIALSLLITENFDLDTVTYTMEQFARADLKQFCRQYEAALAGYDSLLTNYPGHSLTDDVLYRKALIYEQTGNDSLAANLYRKLLEAHGNDLMGDDALFRLARLTELRFNDKTTAMELYQQLLTRYPDSHYIAEARRRFRTLRGDILN